MNKDVLSRILIYLEAEDLIRFARVSRYFNTIAVKCLTVNTFWKDRLKIINYKEIYTKLSDGTIKRYNNTLFYDPISVVNDLDIVSGEDNKFASILSRMIDISIVINKSDISTNRINILFYIASILTRDYNTAIIDVLYFLQKYYNMRILELPRNKCSKDVFINLPSVFANVIVYDCDITIRLCSFIIDISTSLLQTHGIKPLVELFETMKTLKAYYHICLLALTMVIQPSLIREKNTEIVEYLLKLLISMRTISMISDHSQLDVTYNLAINHPLSELYRQVFHWRSNKYGFITPLINEAVSPLKLDIPEDKLLVEKIALVRLPIIYNLDNEVYKKLEGYIQGTLHAVGLLNYIKSFELCDLMLRVRVPVPIILGQCLLNAIRTWVLGHVQRILLENSISKVTLTEQDLASAIITACEVRTIQPSDIEILLKLLENAPFKINGSMSNVLIYAAAETAALRKSMDGYMLPFTKYITSPEDKSNLLSALLGYNDIFIKYVQWLLDDPEVEISLETQQTALDRQVLGNNKYTALALYKDGRFEANSFSINVLRGWSKK